VVEAARKLATDIGPLGLLARVQGARWPAADAYVNGWIAALEGGSPEIALHGTVEVQSVSGRTLGGEPEPKAAVALMTACLGGGLQAVARTSAGGEDRVAACWMRATAG
jgi:hypothetical protein